MSCPHYEIEFTLGTQYSFSFDVFIGDDEQDLNDWGELWFMLKHSAEDLDADAVIEKVLFAGVERVVGVAERAEVTILSTDGGSLDQGKTYRLLGDVGGLDADNKPRQLFTLGATVNPRIRRSNA